MNDCKLDNWHTWKHVLSIADRLKENSGSDSSNLEQINHYLESIEISVGDETDPVDNFKEFALLHLCRALRENLSSEKTNPK